MSTLKLPRWQCVDGLSVSCDAIIQLSSKPVIQEFLRSILTSQRLKTLLVYCKGRFLTTVCSSRGSLFLTRFISAFPARRLFA